MVESSSERVADASEHRSGGFASLGTTVGLLAVAWAIMLASSPLTDNSFFTHLANGRIILDEGSVPTSDPYTFTALGTDWTVQSWLASVAYAGAEQLAGGVGLRLVVLVVFVVAAALLWRLSEPAESIVIRIVIVTAALTVGSSVWSERPYMIGVIGLAVVWLALDGAVRPWFLVPLLWLWANSHGSFPLAILLIVSVMSGTALDRRRSDPSAGGASAGENSVPGVHRAVLKATVAGTFLAAIGPLGPAILTFPLKSITQSGVLSEIVEWQAPEFVSVPERMFLAMVVFGILGVVRSGSWTLALPMVVFTATALVAQRNIVMAVMILVPVMARTSPTVGTLRSGTRPARGFVWSIVCAALVGVLAVASVGSDVTSFDSYPARPLAWLGPSEADDAVGSIAAQDITGNLLEVLDGPRGAVFSDDRADMFPTEVFEDFTDLAHAGPRWQQILDRHEVAVVVWKRSSPLASLLAADDEWRVVFADTSWAVACRRGFGCSELLA